MKDILDMIDRTFGRLVVRNVYRVKGRLKCYCTCECGGVALCNKPQLLSGHVKSCGCLFRETRSNLKHGRHGTPEYVSWKALRWRCNIRNKSDAANYHGRGITVCDRWKSFENFYEDMGDKPDPTYSIERINNDGNYEPSNCKWATDEEQLLNRRCGCLVVFKGEEIPLAHLCRDIGLVPYLVAWKRVFVRNWGIEKAVTHPVRKLVIGHNTKRK